MSGGRKFLIADTHFDHRGIIDLADRPFKDVETMQDTITWNTNEIVHKNDHLYWLGDIGMCNKKRMSELLNRFKCHNNYLILGNHDLCHSLSWWYSLGFFKTVTKWPIIVDDWYILSHAPVYLNKYMPYVNIHGHLHEKTLSAPDCAYVNVSLEQTDYKPVSFDEIKEKYSVDVTE